ncbi:hypothetical protein GTA08_BOTSDO10595 [Neofusicoccum parvum]|uniref:Uncharacterized protein n=1 Tax=Neofusicoccum parvum TaxID=310453 RepID=A0ACB5RUX4_9PEZI|nr:hypothetical protein GTA08_BOTSDO10595 [Neofusicoccum parvum]
MESEYEYLSPDFDPASITVPRLRSILLAHNVKYPSSAKKPDLVALFNEHVAPQAQKYLSAQSRTKRSTKGIIDVPSSRETSVTGDDSEEDEVASLAPSETIKSTTPAFQSTVPVFQSTTPAVKQEERDGASPFSSDNPFQSGSPAYEPRTVERERRRKTLGPDYSEKRKSGTSRRKTELIDTALEDDGALVQSTKTYEAPVARKKRDPTPVVEQEEEAQFGEEQTSEEEQDEADAGEEFTPEEQLELVRERAKQGRTDLLPPRRNKPRQQTSGVLKAAPLTILVALLGGFGAWWRTEKLAVGYCGLGKDPITLDDFEVPEYAKGVEVLLPQCEPCPPHAYCYPDLTTVCESDFILRPHPLSFGSLVPLPPTCEPDSEKARKVKAVADRAVEELRERNAKFECGDLVDEMGQHLPSPEIDEKELKEEISTKRRKGLSQSEFDDLWSSAIGEVMDRDEVVSNIDGESGTQKLASTSLARISLACATRRSLRLALARHLWKLISLLALFGTFLYSKSAWVSSNAMEQRAKLLASFAMDQLKTQAAYHAQDAYRYPEGFISMSQLRDDILRDEFSAKRRQKLWERVQRKVEQNSNVRPSVRENRAGDVSRVWEWVGAIGAIEDRDVKNHQRLTGSDSDALTRGSSELKVKDEMKESKAWDEGRATY